MVAWLRTCGLAEFKSASEMTGYCSMTAGWAATSAMVAAAPNLRPCAADFNTVVEKSREAHQPIGTADILLQQLHHVGAAGDVFGGCVVAAGLGAERERGSQIMRAFQGERVHGSTSPHGTSDASRVLDRRDDVVVGPAAAQVAAHPITNFLRRAGMAFVDAGDASHDLSGACNSRTGRRLSR